MFSNVGGDRVIIVGRLNMKAFSVVSRDIQTDEVVITDKRIAHSNLHDDAYRRYADFIPDVLAAPDYILNDDRPNTAIAIRRIKDTGGNSLQVVVRIKTSSDPEHYRNSIISCWVISQRRLERYLRNKIILYRAD